MLASVPFLIVTFFVYGVVRELRNLHGKCLMCYVFSLTLLYTSLAVINIVDVNLPKDYPNMCIVMGYTSLTSMMMCFLWLNAMCYDIWSTFRFFRISNIQAIFLILFFDFRHGMCHDNIKRFLLYCSYAFGLPILLGLIVFILNHFEFIHEDFNNQIGKETCIVASNDIENQTLLQFIYIYLPIIITISINIVFYSITAYKIYCVQRDTAFKGSESKRHSRNNLDQTR